jgi:hypothetical protein
MRARNLRGRMIAAKMVAEPWATSAAGRAGPAGLGATI